MTLILLLYFCDKRVMQLRGKKRKKRGGRRRRRKKTRRKENRDTLAQGASDTGRKSI
jgi:hypothetical protein